jgi:hypothetical protein
MIRNVFPVRYELGFYIPEDDILHSHRRENLKSYNGKFCWHCTCLVFPYVVGRETETYIYDCVRQLVV